MEFEPGEHFVGIAQGMRGWFATEYWFNPEGFVEPWESDSETYQTRDQALLRAHELAQYLQLRVVPE
jgi:hypothetical protein